ncbi:MAG: hypothetical protein ACUVRD_09225 [Bacteroidia bacterium]
MDPKNLTFLLETLHEMKFLDKVQDRYAPNALSEFLVEDHPESLK